MSAKKIANKGFVIEPSAGQLTTKFVSSEGLSRGTKYAKRKANRRAIRKDKASAFRDFE